MKYLLILAFILLSFNTYSQKEKTTADGLTRDQVKQMYLTPKSDEEFYKTCPSNAGYMYNSLKDYYDNKPIANLRMKHTSFTYDDVSGERMIFIENGVEKKFNAKDMEGKVISTSEGFAVRIQDKHCYILVIDGPICYYWSMQGSVYRRGENQFYFVENLEGKTIDHYSLTNSGVITKLENKEYNSWLEKYGLKEQYDSEKIKREMKDTVTGYMNKEQAKKIKYLLLINEKMK